MSHITWLLHNASFRYSLARQWEVYKFKVIEGWYIVQRLGTRYKAQITIYENCTESFSLIPRAASSVEIEWLREVSHPFKMYSVTSADPECWAQEPSLAKVGLGCTIFTQRGSSRIVWKNRVLEEYPKCADVQSNLIRNKYEKFLFSFWHLRRNSLPGRIYVHHTLCGSDIYSHTFMCSTLDQLAGFCHECFKEFGISASVYQQSDGLCDRFYGLIWATYIEPFRDWSKIGIASCVHGCAANTTVLLLKSKQSKTLPVRNRLTIKKFSMYWMVFSGSILVKVLASKAMRVSCFEKRNETSLLLARDVTASLMLFTMLAGKCISTLVSFPCSFPINGRGPPTENGDSRWKACRVPSGYLVLWSRSILGKGNS